LALPSLRQLQYLVALHEHQHFSRAADACNVTQSTLSAGLKELEMVLGVRLVERTRRVIVFTAVGIGVVRRAEELLLQARDLSVVSQVGPEPLAGAFRLSIIPTIAPFLLPRILTSLRHTYPALALKVHEEMSHEGCAGLSSGTRDCLILAQPYDCGDFKVAPLFDDPIMVAVRSDDALARCAAIDPEDLPADRLLLLHEGHCFRDHALMACKRPDFGPTTAPGASIHTLVQLVNAGMGVMLLPQMAAEAGVMAGTDVVTRPLAGSDARRVISLAWRRNSPLCEGFALLANQIRDIYQGPPLAVAA
jgi:LysR family hydrogen peroxide-inducible transcriptional activator